jgi:hypothetical protein
MSGRSPFGVVLCLPLLLALAERSSAQASLEVLYVQENTTILTYDIDRATLQATQVGQPLALSGNVEDIQLIPAPNGHFVYVLSGPENSNITLSVYATDATGAPQSPAIQNFGPAAISQFAVDPNGRFAYMIEYTENNNEYTYAIRLFTVDTSTGLLTESPQTQDQFQPSSYCAAAIAGFYPNGSELQYYWACYYPDLSSQIAIFEQGVNPKTGALGAPVAFYAYSNEGTGILTNEVRLAPQTINDLYTVDYQTSVKIFPFTASPKKPLIDCTASMLAACGEAGAFWQDVSGLYLFLQLSSDFEIVKVDLDHKRIVDTGNTLNVLETPYLSPDDSILYGVLYTDEPETGSVQIYGFNPNNGDLTTGGQIVPPGVLSEVFTAQRN